MTAPQILVTCKQMQVELPKYRSAIERMGYDVVAPPLGSRQQFSAQELLEFCPRLVGIIAGDDDLSRRFFEGASQLRVVIRWGIGMDSVDHAAARNCGVVVRNTPGVFGYEVADSALGYLLNLARSFVEVDAAVRQGEWPKVEGLTLHGTQLGIVGFGAIGREIARRALAFGMEVVTFDPYSSNAFPNVAMVSLNALLAGSRFVVLACPLTAETKGLMDDQRLALMSQDSYLVNVARGPVVVETALVAALERGDIAGAALDVFEVEPLPAESRLRELPNVILGAHNASNTRQGVERASAVAVDFLLEELGR